ncbi:zinc finger protein ZAT9-like [Solanum dulcamara]|uniref:zinc finger protein ZAT9-like n=1 Tax=Solanum dulcamara TaxID=45834 RepID=UPI0024852D22|nr:zinc finger protein ZAT9-like [Solanum dulcamara]
MEKHKTCKLCSRKFANGRALGGHMRSHMMNLHIEEKKINDETESIPSSSWYSEEEGKILNLDDAVVADDGDGDESVVVLPDKESETESSKNPTRFKRSKRVRKSRKPNFVKITEYYSSVVETEPVSSISENSPEEDVAHCLMMLSRDKWIKKEQADCYSDDDDDEEDEEFKEENSEDSAEGVQVKVTTKTRGRGKYRCETCNKVFRSYQALGGHRASHKKIKVSNEVVESGRNNNVVVEEKIHECPVCCRVFSSGQALGGHKRSHTIGAAVTTSVNVLPPPPPPATDVSSTKLELSRTGGTSLIDLNFPPPMEDDDEIISQVEVSAVSDAEFVNPIKNQR